MEQSVCCNVLQKMVFCFCDGKSDLLSYWKRLSIGYFLEK